MTPNLQRCFRVTTTTLRTVKRRTVFRLYHYISLWGGWIYIVAECIWSEVVWPTRVREFAPVRTCLTSSNGHHGCTATWPSWSVHLHQPITNTDRGVVTKIMMNGSALQHGFHLFGLVFLLKWTQDYFILVGGPWSPVPPILALDADAGIEVCLSENCQILLYIYLSYFSTGTKYFGDL